MKRVAPHVHIRDGLLDLRHVASDALIAGAACFVMGVFLDRGCMRAIRRTRAVTIEAKNIGRLSQERIVVGTMRIMATETSDAACIHQTGREVIALHAIFVSGTIRKMREGCVAQLMFFQLPEVA